MYVFAYGSLTNPESLAKTLPGERAVLSSRLNGYRRAFNKKTRDGYLALNIVSAPEYVVDGVMFSVTDDDLAKLDRREDGYTRTDVSACIDTPVHDTVYAYIAPDTPHSGLVIPYTYVLTCLGRVESARRDEWMNATRIDNEIYNDLALPMYGNRVLPDPVPDFDTFWKRVQRGQLRP